MRKMREPGRTYHVSDVAGGTAVTSITSYVWL